MRTIKYTYWQDGDYFLGYWLDYPDYQTQGQTKDELISNLKDLLQDIESGTVPFILKVEESEKPMQTLTPEEIAIYKAMSPVQKLKLIDRFYRDARTLKRASLRTLHPDWTDAEVDQKLVQIFQHGTI